MLYAFSNASILLFITYFFTGFKISDSEPGYFIGLTVLFSFLNYFLDPLIKFFTLKIKFLTVWLFDFLLAFPLLYFIKVFVTGIHIDNGTFRRMNFGAFEINSFPTNDIITIIVSAVLIGFMAAFIRWLIEKV